MATFPERLKELRKAKGDTQIAMAEFLGIRERSYQNYEQGKREPNYETTIKIADYFNVSIDYLLGRSNNSARQ
ncbi:MAG: helix-turn-helix domain-containing protein [Defluviitaleaceae bacterium]|nr:helix-turn-helix domain-containing protein [Defluviitaleaceae bacterium]